MILVPLFDLKFLTEFAAGGVGNFKSAALGAEHILCASSYHRAGIEKLFHLLEKLAEVTRACDQTQPPLQSPTCASIACSSAATAMVGTVTSTIPAKVVVVSNMLAELMMT